MHCIGKYLYMHWLSWVYRFK